jgi:hypothetical protein
VQHPEPEEPLSIVKPPVPTRLTLLGRIQAPLKLMVEAGSNTVMGAVFVELIPENGLL